jgi:hypothetical protein
VLFLRIILLPSNLTFLAILEDDDAGDDADDEDEFPDEYELTPKMLERLLELERTANLSEPAPGKY